MRYGNDDCDIGCNIDDNETGLFQFFVKLNIYKRDITHT